MDSTSLTHVAAILVGVIITLFLVKSTQAPSKEDPSGSSAGTASAASKKKKKKKASKGGGEATSAAPAPVPAVGKKQQQKKKGTPPAAAAAKEDKAAAVPENGNKDNGTAGKKKKKKKGGGAAPATNGSAKAANNNNNKENKAPKASSVADEIPAEFLKDAIVPPQQAKEEEWVTEEPKKKKKGNRPKPAKPAAPAAGAAASSNPSAPAAAAAPAPAPAAVNLTESISIDAKKVGIVIGPKGATMMAIQEATGCKLDINAPSKDEKNPGTKAGVVISGPDKDSVIKAKKAVQELATKGYAKLLQSDNFGEFSISVHPRFLSEIVGPKGQTIQALQKTLDVKISIPSTEWKPNAVQVGHVKPALVGIAGSKESAKTCKEAIKDLMLYHHHEITHPGMIHEEVYVPSEFFHCVIGPRGSEVKHIRGNYKVDVYMPGKEGDSTENVIVVGRKANVDKAIAYIQLLMDRDVESREKKYSDEYYG